MKRMTLVVAAAALSISVGCTMPLPSGVNRKTDDSAKTTVSRTPVFASSIGTDPVSNLRVNGDVVSAEELWRYEREELEKYRKLGQPEYRAYVDRRAVRLITDRITEMLLFQHASLRLPPEADKTIDKYVDGEIRKIITSDHGGVQRRFDRHLAGRGMTLDDLRADIRREIVIAGFLQRELKPKVMEPTRAELLAVFQTNRDEWRRPARRKMSLIDVRLRKRLPEGVTDPTPEQLDAAREDARSIIRTAEVELRNGAEFADLARRHSDGLHAQEGGTWGWVNKESVRERFVPALEALDKLNESDVGPVIEGADAFFLVRCDEVEPAVEPSFEGVQPRLKERHASLTYNRLLEELVRELRGSARMDPPDLERFHAAAVQVALELKFD